jgi:hypothetical protein
MASSALASWHSQHSEIVVAQGYDSLTTLLELTDDTISGLITALRKPGGMIPNPGGPALPHIPNPGINVGHRATANLKLTAFIARHYQCTSRTMDNPVATLAANHIWTFVGLNNNAEDAYTDPGSPPVLEKIDKIREHIENLDAHLLK